MKINIYQFIKNLFIVSSLILTISCKKGKIKTDTTSNKQIENYINHIIKRHQIPGVSLAIIKNDSIFICVQCNL